MDQVSGYEAFALLLKKANDMAEDPFWVRRRKHSHERKVLERQHSVGDSKNKYHRKLRFVPFVITFFYKIRNYCLFY